MPLTPWPPALPPADRTDNTASATNHADDHNKTATALKTITDVLGASPALGGRTVSSRLAGLAATGGRLGDVMERRPRRKVPLTECATSVTVGGFSADYVAAGATFYPAPTLKALDLVESNYDAADVVTVSNYLGTSYGADTAQRPATGTLAHVPHDLEFVLEGDYVALGWHQYAAAHDVRVFVDDEEIADWTYAAAPQGKSLISTNGAGSIFVVNLKFPTKGTRRIRIVGPEYITGLVLNAGDTLHRPARRRRLFVSSDSFYVSVQPSGLNQAVSLRTLTGLTVINGAIGGTGYVKPTPYGDSTRLARLAAEDPANLVGVIVNGGANDLTGPTVAQVTAAQTALYTAIRNLVPDTPIVVVGMEDSAYFRANYGAAVDTLGAAIKATALAHPAVVKFVDMLAEDWFQGTGYAGAPNGTGNTNRLIGPDGVHLTDAGVDYAATLTAEHLRVTPATAGAAA